MIIIVNLICQIDNNKTEVKSLIIEKSIVFIVS